MLYRKFRIRNFRGIKDTTIDLTSRRKQKIFTLVGLNESGKTTILEAIYRFRPDLAASVVTGGPLGGSPDNDIPKHRISNFTDKITISAEVEMTDDDITTLSAYILNNFNLQLDNDSVNRVFQIHDIWNFESSKFIKKNRIWDFKPKATNTKGRRKTDFLSSEQWQSVVSFMTERLPTISYFPTQVFDFPERIYLTEKDLGSNSENKKNAFYKKLFQDILDTQGEGLNIEENIVKRIHDPSIMENLFSSLFGASSITKQSIDQIFLKASATVSSVIFNKWNEIFKSKQQPKQSNTSHKKVKIVWVPETISENQKPDIFIQFMIEDGSRQFEISTRSLGFRWFFCFLIFTQFQSNKNSKRNQFFLFDEPASNLHSEAQSQLLNSFPAIVKGDNILMYSTHSHYMIEPTWLEGAFVVESSIDDDINTIEQPWNENVADIVATPYRQFVGKNPTKITYFQPILDKLEYRPSSMELCDRAVIFEGKSDFYLMRYFSKYIFSKNINMFPGTGATNLDLFVALFLGWGHKFVVVFDGDKKGLEARERYREEYSIPDHCLLLIPNICGDNKVKGLESLLCDDDLEVISKRFDTNKLNKGMISQFFAEISASGEIVQFSELSKKRISSALNIIENTLNCGQ